MDAATSSVQRTPTTTATVLVITTTSASPAQSGLRGVTSDLVASGLPDGELTGGPASLEFAVVPVGDEGPLFSEALFVTSDDQGEYEVALPPGTYWIGPKGKVLDPDDYDPGATSFSEMVVDVVGGMFTQVDLTKIGYAP